MASVLKSSNIDENQTSNPCIVPPGMETPEGSGTAAGEPVIQKSRQHALSAPRLLIIAGALMIAAIGLIFTLSGNSGVLSTIVTVLALGTWFIVGWFVRNQPISAKSRELDAHLNDARIKAEAANHAKTRFLAIASHEMRTPLNGILGMSKLLDDTSLSLEQKNYNQAIKASGDALFSFIEDMLDITRIETGHFTLTPQTTNIRTRMENICELLSHRAYEKNLEIATVTDIELPETINIDARRLQQVLVNLLGNAIKFTSHGGVTLKAGKHIAGNGACYLQFVVTDTGPGIRDEDKARIFSEFEQADIETTRKFGGAGLGLSISKAIVEKMNGTITIRDNQPNGSKFIVEIPMPPNVDAPQATPTHETGKILLVSSRDVEVKLLAEMVTQSGFDVEVISDMNGVAPLLEAEHIHSVIIDDALVEQNIDVLRRYGSRTNFIVMLQPAQRRKLENLQSKGFSSYLIRPVRYGSLKLVLNGISEFRAADALYNQPREYDQDLSPGKNILLVEDNAINSLLARSALEKQGHQVELAQNGKIALDMFKDSITTNRPYDLVYMDLHMPVMDGLTAISSIRNVEKNARVDAVRIVALSADEQNQTRSEVKQAGADGFLSKPLDPDKLATDANI